MPFEVLSKLQSSLGNANTPNRRTTIILSIIPRFVDLGRLIQISNQDLSWSCVLEEESWRMRYECHFSCY